MVHRMFELFALYLLVMNAATFAAFALDKRAATRGEWRIPEARLLGLAMFGGSPAALAAQQLLRHKTRKQPFGASLWMIVAAHAALLGAYLTLR
jgi:uncharacterized membrane protein YsdA (DUF1294 family)